MSDVGRLIEKLGLAIAGEQRPTVLKVLAAFTRTLLEEWGVPLEEYVEALRGCGLDDPVARRAKMD